MLEDPPAWLPSDERLRRFLGDSALYPFYRLKLTEYVSRLLPQGPCSILDVGAGDGSLGLVFQTFRPATRVVGIEVALRAATRPGAPTNGSGGRRMGSTTVPSDGNAIKVANKTGKAGELQLAGENLEFATEVGGGSSSTYGLATEERLDSSSTGRSSVSRQRGAGEASSDTMQGSDGWRMPSIWPHTSNNTTSAPSRAAVTAWALP